MSRRSEQKSRVMVGVYWCEKEPTDLLGCCLPDSFVHVLRCSFINIAKRQKRNTNANITASGGQEGARIWCPVRGSEALSAAALSVINLLVHFLQRCIVYWKKKRFEGKNTE